MNPKPPLTGLSNASSQLLPRASAPNQDLAQAKQSRQEQSRRELLYPPTCRRRVCHASKILCSLDMPCRSPCVCCLPVPPSFKQVPVEGVQVNETGQRRFFFERRQWSEIPAVACAHLYRAAFVDLVSLREVNPSAHAQKANLTVN